jgi:PAS domain S-box-containing protein
MNNQFFPGDGEMARRCRELDWARTPLGAPESWPPALCTAVRMALECPFPINLWCGPDMMLIYNDGYRAVLGAKHPSALGRPGAEVWAEIWSDIEPMFRSVRDGGPSVYAEDAHFRMERAEGPGDDAWFTFSVSPVRNDAGDVVAYFNVATETTDRVREKDVTRLARAAAERAERQLREIFRQAPAFLAVLRGAEHVFEFANAAYLQLVGRDDIIGKPVDEALPEVREQGFVSLLDRVLHTGDPFVGREIPITLKRTPDGPPEEVYVDFVYQPIVDERGERSGIVAHGSEVTDAVRARREIERLYHESEHVRAEAQSSEQRYRFLADSIPVHVWTATPDGALDYVSDRTARYFGRTAEAVIGAQWLGVLHPDDVPMASERWSHSLTSGQPYEVEFRLWSAEHNDYRWHLARATAQRDESGTIVRWFGTNTEIEDRKQVEAELKRLTIEATEANRAKGDFLAAMSHELRTPLNAIGGYAQLIEMGVRGPITEAQRIDLLKIQRSKNHLDGLVSDVLNFAKMGSGRIEFRVRDVGVGQLIESVLEMVSPQLAQKSIVFEAPSAPPQLTVRADDDKARQILLNLFSNALKFTPAGGTISLSLETSDNAVCLGVQDTGIGIPDDQLERIFEPFVQAKRALLAADQGVGLGLAISRQLARAMNGDLTVRSAVGKGSSFTLRLPRRV